MKLSRFASTVDVASKSAACAAQMEMKPVKASLHALRRRRKALHAPKERFIFCGVAAKCFMKPCSALTDEASRLESVARRDYSIANSGVFSVLEKCAMYFDRKDSRIFVYVSERRKAAGDMLAERLPGVVVPGMI